MESKQSFKVTKPIHFIHLFRLVCCGSSLFLKSLYGVGYYLTLVKQQPQKKQQPTEPEFDGVVAVASEQKASESCSLNSIEGTEDEGISDISTHDNIINPSDLNEK